MSKMLLALNTTVGVSDAGREAHFSTLSAPALIGLFIRGALSVLGVIFLVMLIYGGFTWMTSQGNEKAVEKAKSIIIQASIGVVICLTSYAISTYFFNALNNSLYGQTQSTCMDASCGL